MRPTLTAQDMDLRERCLRMALETPEASHDRVGYAHTYLAFITGKSNETPGARILQAMEDAGVR